MSLKLYGPVPGKTSFYRIRGSFLGVRVDRSTGTTNGKLAEKMLRDEIRRIEDEAMRGPAKPKGKTFIAGVKSYVLGGGDKRFVEPLVHHFKDIEMSEITQDRIDDAAFAIYPDATPATRNRQVHTVMSAILKANHIHIPIARPKGWRGAKRTFFFEPAEVEKLLVVASGQDAEFGLFLTYLFYTGLRLNEALSLQIRNLNLSEARAFIETTKNGLPRTVHLPVPLVAALANHPRGYDREGRVFRFFKGGRLYARLDKAAEAAGVVIPDGVSFHAFRHTYGAYLRRYGNLDTSGLVASGAWLSHDAARRYEHTDVNAAAKASEAFPKIQIFGSGSVASVETLSKQRVG